MASDSIVAEVRAIREAYARQFDYDLRAICRDLQEQEKESGRKTVSFPSKRIEGIEQIPPAKD